MEIDEHQSGQRVDNFLFRQLKGVPKSAVYKIIRKGQVRVNKGRVKQTTRLQQGDLIRIPPMQTTGQASATSKRGFEQLNKAVIFEDDALLVMNKPSGFAVHGGSGIKAGVIEQLRAGRNDLSYLELAHRLDRATSGCLVLAKSAKVLRALAQDFQPDSSRNSKLTKRYTALLKGNWRLGKQAIVKPLDTDARVHGERHVRVSESGVYAKSIFQPYARGRHASLLKVTLKTGRTHQIRVHASAMGHPVAGDDRYGDAEFNKKMREFGLNRLFLHASSLQLMHPVSLQKLQFDAPLDDALNSVLEKLKISL